MDEPIMTFALEDLVPAEDEPLTVINHNHKYFYAIRRYLLELGLLPYANAHFVEFGLDWRKRRLTALYNIRFIYGSQRPALLGLPSTNEQVHEDIRMLEVSFDDLPTYL